MVTATHQVCKKCELINKIDCTLSLSSAFATKNQHKQATKAFVEEPEPHSLPTQCPTRWPPFVLVLTVTSLFLSFGLLPPSMRLNFHGEQDWLMRTRHD